MDYQSSEEFFKLAQIVKSYKPLSILEIGSMYGDTLQWWMMISPIVMSIDLPLPGHDPRKQRQEEAYKLWDRWALLTECKFKSFKGDSHSSEAYASALYYCDGFDFLFIDGDHSYEGVKKDAEMYAPLVKKGGIIAFHDIVPNPNYGDIQVYRYWNEIKVQHKYFEIITKPNEFGIGVLFL